MSDALGGSWVRFRKGPATRQILQVAVTGSNLAWGRYTLRN